MSDLTKRGLRALGVGIVVFLVGVAFTASGSDTLTALAPLVDLMSGVLMLVGVVLTVAGLFRRS